MSQADRIMICVAAHNRRRVAELCLPTLADALRPQDELHLYNDGSSEYDAGWLAQWAGVIAETYPPLGIEGQRRLHLRNFWESCFDFLFLTDHDAIHSPSAFERALDMQHDHGDPLACLYDTVAHSRLAGNTISDDPASDVIWRRYAPGVSYFLSRANVAKIMPHVDSLTSFDWQIPDILGNRCAISRISYTDHIGWGGRHHPPEEGLNGGDRALNPTPILAAMRAEIVEKLKSA